MITKVLKSCVLYAGTIDINSLNVTCLLCSTLLHGCTLLGNLPKSGTCSSLFIRSVQTNSLSQIVSNRCVSTFKFWTDTFWNIHWILRRTQTQIVMLQQQVKNLGLACNDSTQHWRINKLNKMIVRNIISLDHASGVFLFCCCCFRFYLLSLELICLFPCLHFCILLPCWLPLYQHTWGHMYETEPQPKKCVYPNATYVNVSFFVSSKCVACPGLSHKFES